MSDQTIKLTVTRESAVAIITLNRPACLNAIDLDLAIGLKEALEEVADDPGVRAAIITGSGRAFCSGGDLKLALSVSPERPGEAFLELTRHLHACVRLLQSMPKPTLAAINGPAAGAGFFLALACDLRIMTESAYLRQSNTRFGLTPPAGGSWLLPRLIGTARALEMLFLDEPVSARLAQSWGLVNWTVPDDALRQSARSIAERMTRMPVHTLGRAKALLRASGENPLNEHLDVERSTIAASANTAEGLEGLHAFVEKRVPDYLATTDSVTTDVIPNPVRRPIGATAEGERC